MKIKTNKNVFYSCKYPVIGCPKYRRKVLVDGIDSRLKEIILCKASSVNVEILEMEVMPDHVHLLIEVDPQYGVHRFVRQTKGLSSKILREEYPRLKSRLPTLWTNSYFVSSVRGDPLTTIKQYIERQKRV